MADAATSRSRRLVGQPLLYSISVFVSLGVFLVRLVPACLKAPLLMFAQSSDMTKGALIPPISNLPLRFPPVS